ncbi:uncharacterized protein LOC121393411 [Xenopus laevis]|uniref:Uncharacterized protein LOC121393411 n=1 Tax=Xenopus laevis TaxID=8355 RepID=A0A8J1KKG5_XENLA|nr:uncharacterized protein LOC121393411 [Xenopus laevis]
MSFADIAKTTDKIAEVLSFSEQDRNQIVNDIKSFSLPDLASPGDVNRQLNSLMRRECNLKCHATALVEYLKVKRIPRGLRVPLAPILCKNDSVYKKEWNMILNRCSLDLMALTIRHLQTALQQVQQQITLTEQELRKNHREMESTLSEIRAEIAQYERELMLNKIRKFKRDTDDYASEQVYTWKTYRREQRNKRQAERRPGRTISDVSSSSGSSNSQAAGDFLSSTPAPNENIGRSEGGGSRGKAALPRIRMSQRKVNQR